MQVTNSSFSVSTVKADMERSEFTNVNSQEQLKIDSQSSFVLLSQQAQSLSMAGGHNPSIQSVYAKDKKSSENAKALATYKMISNLGDDSISASEAYAIKNNDTAREMYFGQQQLEHQAELVENYMLSNTNEEDQEG